MKKAKKVKVRRSRKVEIEFVEEGVTVTMDVTKTNDKSGEKKDMALEVNRQNVTPANPISVEAGGGSTNHPWYSGHMVSNITQTGFSVQVQLTEGRPLRICYAPVDNPGDVTYTNPELSNTFTSHTQSVNGLTADTEYQWKAQSSSANDDTGWFDLNDYQSITTSASSGQSTGNFPALITTLYDNSALENIPSTFPAGASFTDSTTGVKVVRLPLNGTSVDSSKPPISADNKYLYLQGGSGAILDIQDRENITVMYSSSALGAQSTWHPTNGNLRYGKASNKLQSHSIDTNALTPVLDDGGSEIAMDTLGQGKGTMSANGVLPIVQGNNCRFYQVNDTTGVATLIGTVNVGHLDDFNGFRISKNGQYALATNGSGSASTEGLYLYKTDGTAVITGVDLGLGTNNIVPFTDNRSQHAAWGVEDDFGNPCILISEAESFHVYDVVAQETIAFPFNETLNNGNNQRFGNGFGAGHNYNLDGWGYFATDEFDGANGGTRRNIISVRLARGTGTHTINKPGSNVVGTRGLTDHRRWCTSGGGGTSGSRPSASYDGTMITFTSNVTGSNEPYLAYVP